MFGRPRKTKPKRQLSRLEDEESIPPAPDAEEAAETKYGNFQGNVANMLMMGTLIFGFVATGTFLSIQFTGDEQWSNVKRLVLFVRYGMYSAISSLTATMTVFVFSTRASRQHSQYGAVAAMRTVERSTIFFVLAEILLYFSLHEFVNSIQTYSIMEYVGPKICPVNANVFSPCSQTGADLYQAAQLLCGPAAQTLDGESWTEDSDLVEQSLRAAPRPMGTSSESLGTFFTCTAFDYYTMLSVQRPDRAAYKYFAWDRGDTGYQVVTTLANDAGNSFEYDGPTLPEINQMDLDESDEAFFSTLNVLGNAFCGKPQTETGVQQLCAGASASSASCMQARIADLMADDCSGKKQDDAIKCSKVCKWISSGEDGDADPLKIVVRECLDTWIYRILVLIKIMMVLRTIAGLIQVVLSCGKLAHIAKSAWAFVFAADIFGLLDTWEGYHHRKDDDDLEHSDDNL